MRLNCCYEITSEEGNETERRIKVKEKLTAVQQQPPQITVTTPTQTGKIAREVREPDKDGASLRLLCV